MIIEIHALFYFLYIFPLACYGSYKLGYDIVDLYLKWKK